MTTSLKIVIPMAGFGTRLRPHTWSKPKQLIPIAGKPLLSHVLLMLDSLPPTMPREYVFITGYLGDQIQAYTDRHYPELKIHYVEQREMLGQSHAIYQARQYLNGPMLMVFADTLIETDLRFLKEEKSEAVVWVREVPDPRRFGIAEIDGDGWVQRIVEKPPTFENRQAVVGFYYFPDAGALCDAIETQLVQDIRIKGEYYLAGAVNQMLAGGLRMRTEPVTVWLDAGTKETTLETNAHLLERGHANFNKPVESDGISILPPVYIAPTAEIEGSIIGPHVSIGAGCRVRGSTIRNSIVENGAVITGCQIQDSMIGQRAILHGVKGIISAGDDASYSSNSPGLPAAS